MKCPHCQGVKLTQSVKNYINIEPKDGYVVIGHELTRFQPVYVCDVCGFVWERKDVAE